MRRVHDEFVRRIYYSCLLEEVKSIRALHDKYYAGSEGSKGGGRLRVRSTRRIIGGLQVKVTIRNYLDDT
jgi:hypothetical protein